MKYRYLSIFLILLILSIGAVSAQENATTDGNVANVQSNVSSEIVITDNNYNNYFNSTTGEILENSNISDGSILKFGNVSGKIFVIDKNLTITSNSSSEILNGVTFTFIDGSEGSVAENLIINCEDAQDCLFYVWTTDITIRDNNIKFVGAQNVSDIYAVYAYFADNLNIQANVITYIGKTNGTGYNSAVSVASSENVIVEGNTFSIRIPSADVDWIIGLSRTSGVTFVACDELQFDSNTIYLITNESVGDFPTVYGIEIKNSDDVVVEDNDVNIMSRDINGSYVYALVIQGKDFIVFDNFFESISNTNYVCGISIEGKSMGIVDENAILLSSPFVAYGIYACDYNFDGQAVDYTNNYITGESYAVYGMELFYGTESTIDGNEIKLRGNYTTGITEMMTYYGALITNNIIDVSGTNNDTGNSGDYYSPAMTVGILSMGESTIKNNVITSAGNWTVLNSGYDVEITDNYLVSSELLGDESVQDNADDAVVKNNIPVKGQTNYNLTNDTFYLFFDDYGCLRDNITAESLTFIGEFSNLVDTIIILDPIKLFGDNAKLYDIELEIYSDNVTVDGLNFISDELSRILWIHDSNNVSIINSTFELIDEGIDDSTVVYITDSVVEFAGNNITYVGNTDGSYYNRVMAAYDSEVNVQDSRFIAELVSVPVEWNYDPQTYTYNPDIKSLGVYFYNSGVVFSGNYIFIEYSNFTGPSDTIYELYVEECDAPVITNNVIKGMGHTYMYGLTINAEDFNVSSNIFYIDVDNNCVWGIDVEGRATGIVDNNEIYLNSPYLSYGIYACDWNMEGQYIGYTNNRIELESYMAYGMELLFGEETYIELNTLILNGNYTLGIASMMMYDAAVITNNIIRAYGTNNDINKSSGDMVPAMTAGILAMSESKINGNNISSSGYYTIVNSDEDSVICYNELFANVLVGDDSVDDRSEEADVRNNIPTATNYKVTNDTFFLFFDDYGYLKSTISVESLTFIGEFSNLVEGIIIDSPISLLSDNATLNNMSIYIIGMGPIYVDGFNFVGPLSEVYVCAENVVISNNYFNNDVYLKGREYISIYISRSNNVRVLDNKIIASIETNDTCICAPVYAENSDDLFIQGNMIVALLPARPIDWTTGSVSTLGLFLNNCDDAKLYNNTVAVKSSGQIGTYDTIYAVHIVGDNAVILENKIGVLEAPYGYALVVSGENFLIEDNMIVAGQNNSYSCAVDIESNSNGLIKDNLIASIGESSYGIYTADWAGPVSVNITNNIIGVNGTTAFGMSLSGSDYLVAENIIAEKGNYTTGIASAVDNITVNNNTIAVFGSNVGIPAGYDMMGIETTGVHIVSGSASVTNNKINSTGKYAVDFEGEGKVTDNELYAELLTGDFAVRYVQDQDTFVANNTPKMELDYIVTNDTFFIYFDDFGYIREQIDSDVLTFVGEFSNLVEEIYVDRPINLTSDSACLNNIGITVESDDVVVDGFMCIGEDSGISVFYSDNVQILNNEITISNTTYDSNFAIEIIDSNNVTIDGNRIILNVETNETASNKVIYAEDSDKLNISNNVFRGQLPARPINWTSGEVYTQGVFLNNCDDLTFDNNTVSVISNDQISTYDTIYAVQIVGDNATITGNKIVVDDAPYGYALVVSGEDFLIEHNIIGAGDDGDYACAVNIESNSNGIINKNLIVAMGESAYGIYTANWAGDVKANITNNIIYIDANTAFGMSLSGSESVVDNNTFMMKGNYTTGIASAVSKITIVNNTIDAKGSNVGTPAGYDMMGIETTGIHIVSGSATVTDNNVTTTGDFTVHMNEAAEGQVTDNYLVAKENTGDASVDYTPSQGTIVKDNIPAMEKVFIVSDDVQMHYKDGTKYNITLTDASGNPLANKPVTITINGVTYNRTTDENGTASLAINLDSGDYEVSTSFAGESGYGKTTIESDVSILPTVYGENLVKVYRNASQYYATFLDNQGNLLANTSVTFNINGAMYNRKTNENGTAKLNINLDQGNYIVTAINSVTGESRSNNITVLPTITDNTDLVKYYKNASQYVVTLVGDDGNPVGAGEVVTFNINGVFYNRTTNASGQAKLNINLDPGNYTITAEYKGCKVSNNIEVKPVLSASDLTKKYGDPEPFIITLVDGQGNPYPDQKIEFNINGVMYYRATNATGQAKLNINLQPGEFIITTGYNGTYISNKVTVTA